MPTAETYEAGVVDYLLIAGTAVAVLVPLAMRVYRRRFDVFEPLTVASFAILLLFVARPLYDFLADHQWFGFDHRLDWRGALVAAFVGVVAFELGYNAPFGRRLAARIAAPPDDTDGHASFAVASALTVVAAATVIALAYSRGGFGELFEKRGRVEEWILPPTAEAFLVALPATLLFLAAAIRGRWVVGVLAALPAGLILVMAVPAGHRRYLMPLLLALVVFAYLVRGRRPAMLPVAIAVVLLVVLVIEPVRESRTGQVSYVDAALDSTRNPHRAFERLLQDADTAAVEALAVEEAVLGDEVPYRYGLDFANNTVLAPIPRQLWPEKPEKTRTLVIEHLYGPTEAGKGCNVLCPAFSFFGDAAADAGLVSVTLISALFGFLLATAYEYFLRHRTALLAQVAYASGLWLAFQPWIAGISLVTTGFILTVLPVGAVALLSLRRVRAKAARQRHTPRPTSRSVT